MKEPEDLTFRLTKIEKDYTVSEENVAQIKDFFETLKEVVNHAFPGNYCHLIPVGSFLIGCMTTYNTTIDCYIHFDKREDITDELFDVKSICQQIENVLQSNARFARAGYSCEIPSQNKEILLFKDIISKSAVKLIPSPINNGSEGSKINHCTACMYHSNWLISNYNQSTTAWQAVKLFRLIRIWQ